MKKVFFDEVMIKEYPNVLGDHPAVYVVVLVVVITLSIGHGHLSLQAASHTQRLVVADVLCIQFCQFRQVIGSTHHHRLETHQRIRD